MTQVIKDVVTWLKQWFYTESEVDTLLGGKVSTAQGSSNASKNVVTDSGGNITLEAKPTIPSASSTTPSADTTSGAVGTGTTWARADHKHPKSSIYAEATHAHSISDVTSLQSELDDLDDRIDDLESIKAIEVVVSLPTASADTMGRLYIISENSKINVYYTITDGQSYEWHKMDADILDELSIAWNDITGKPSTFPPSNHNHGSITSSGQISGDTGGNICVTKNDGLIGSATSIYATQLKDTSAHSNIGSSANAFQSTINTNIDTALGGKAPTSHSSSATTYGVGTTSNYGHNKVINDLNHNSFSNGESLSAYQGYVLRNAINGKQDEITSIVLVDKATDSTGKIIFYTGDEPS